MNGHHHCLIGNGTGSLYREGRPRNSISRQVLITRASIVARRRREDAGRRSSGLAQAPRDTAGRDLGYAARQGPGMRRRQEPGIRRQAGTWDTPPGRGLGCAARQGPGIRRQAGTRRCAAGSRSNSVLAKPLRAVAGRATGVVPLDRARSCGLRNRYITDSIPYSSNPCLSKFSRNMLRSLTAAAS